MKTTKWNITRQAVRLSICICGPVLVSQGWGGAPPLFNRPDIVFEDFEGTNYGNWQATGTAFGPGPARGTLPNQMPVAGYLGNGLVDSYYGGDDSTGTLASQPFKIQRKYLRFLIGGGGFPGKTCIDLLCNGKVIRTATGPNTEPGGSEHLDWQGWDVSAFAGKSVVVQIVDQATGTWGHINIDQIIQTDHKPSGLMINDARITFKAEKRYLNLPVKNGAPRRTLRLMADGKTEREFEIELAAGKPDWWAFLDLSTFKGQSLELQTDKLPEDSMGLKQVVQSDAIKGAGNMYDEALRPQFHFSARRGWLNDPNGLVFYHGQYHLFFQHSPFSWDDTMKHWGHATSRDLVHWTEQPEVLYPDELGAIWSGSAVVDWNDTSGLSPDGRPPIVLIYTSAGAQFTQCLAYSTDGGTTFTKYAGNPVLRQITGGNRDPRVFWYEPARHWVMVLWVEWEHQNTVHFLSSPNLKDWTVVSRVNGFFECPDFFELPVDGNAANEKWVLTAASSEYEVGLFDGEKFTAETPKLPGVWSGDFYAAQTYSDIPASDGRRIQIGWLRAPSPGMPFNQCMSLPLELKLLSTPDGPRLARLPVAELTRLRKRTYDLGPMTLKAGDANPLAKVPGELLELRAEFEPDGNRIINFNVRGVPVSYDSTEQVLTVAGHRAPAPLRGGKQSLIFYIDRTTLEVFASDGLVYVPMAVIPGPDAPGLGLSVTGGPVKFSKLAAYQLRRIWE